MTGTRKTTTRSTPTTRTRRRGRPRKMAEVLPPTLEQLAKDMERDGQRLLDAAKAIRDSVKK